MTAAQNLVAAVSDYVASLFSTYSPRRYTGTKVIHDNLWGTNRYYPHELAVIDSPLIQRLRYIRQTGLAFVAYPSLNHTRFEHSLGMVTITSRLMQKLKERHYRDEIPGFGPLPDDPRSTAFAELRMAALLHDCGHGFLSHASEAIYRWYPEIAAVRQQEAFTHSKPSEILAYLIVTSPTFRQFFSDVASAHNISLDIDLIANMILGRAIPSHQFLADIINGALDTDKLDYISRDSLFSGVTTPIDIDRLFNELSIFSFANGVNTLVISSALPLERIMFSKVLLYTTIYHHQKVKAADSMVESALEYVKESGDRFLGSRFGSAVDFLRFADHDVLSSNLAASTPVLVKRLIDDLMGRRIWQRCLVLSKYTIDNYDSHVPYFVNRLSQSRTAVRDLRGQIARRLPNADDQSVYNVWVSLPEQPSLREATQTLALVAGQQQPEVVNSLFPLDGWLRAFSDNKWKGYVFGPAEMQAQVAEAAWAVLSEMGFRLNANSVYSAHVDHPVAGPS